MKIRNGFVSNSSSSSFIISDAFFPNVRSLAKYMINKQIEEYKFECIDKIYFIKGDIDDDYRYTIQELLEKYNIDDSDFKYNIERIKENEKNIKRLNNIDENHPISFKSCSFDTYIRKVGDCYLVNTCNNTSWELWEYTTKLTDKATNELSNYNGVYNCEQIDNILDGDYEFYFFGDDFYNLDNDIIGIELDESKHCNSKSHYIWSTKKFGKICLTCLKLRLDKLNNINNINNED